MSAYRNPEDAWFWACTSLGLHRAVDRTHVEFRLHRPEDIRLALDRFYRRRHVVLSQKQNYRGQASIRPRPETAECREVALRSCSPVSDGAVELLELYPHV